MNTEVQETINLCPPSPASLGLELRAKFSKFMQNYKESTTVYVDYHLSGEWRPGPSEGIKSGAPFGRQKSIYGGYGHY